MSGGFLQSGLRGLGHLLVNWLYLLILSLLSFLLFLRDSHFTSPRIPVVVVFVVCRDLAYSGLR